MGVRTRSNGSCWSNIIYDLMVDPDVVFPTRYMAVAMNIPAVLFFFWGGSWSYGKDTYK